MYMDREKKKMASLVGRYTPCKPERGRGRGDGAGREMERQRERE